MIPGTDEQRRSVEVWLRRRALPPRPRERLEMVKALSLGQEVGAIALRPPPALQRWRRWNNKVAEAPDR